MSGKKNVLMLLVVLLMSSALVNAVPVTFISPDQITGAPFSITAPGRYVLTDDVAFSRSGGTAITISSSDVTLDLNGKAIINSGPGTETCISLASTFTNITIKNGTLRVFDGTGISVNAGSDYVFEDIIIIGRAMPGAEVGTGFSFAGSRISGITMNNCFVSNCVLGILAQFTDAVKITNSSFNYNTIGVRGISCNGWDLYNSHASFNASTAQAIGLDLRSCNNWTIKHSNFSGNNSTLATLGVRFSISLGSGVSGGHIIENCTFNHNLSTAGMDALSFESTSSCIIKNCTFNGNGSVTAGSNGMNITGSAVIIENCVANGNFAASETRGCLITGTGHVIRNCEFSGNLSSGFAGGTGLWIFAARGILVENCRAIGNNGVIVGLGFFTQTTVKSIVKNCTSAGNVGSSGANSRGFQGGTNAGDVLFIGNIAFGQATNYQGTLIPFLSVAATGPYPLAGSFDNRSLANLSFT